MQASGGTAWKSTASDLRRCTRALARHSAGQDEAMLAERHEPYARALENNPLVDHAAHKIGRQSGR